MYKRQGNDFAISRDALVTNQFEAIRDIFRSEPTTAGNGWRITLEGPPTTQVNLQTTFQAVAVCFINPGP